MKGIITETEDEKLNCLFCKHFKSYMSIYEDEMEPKDIGVCGNDKNKDKDKTCCEETVCELFEFVSAK